MSKLKKLGFGNKKNKPGTNGIVDTAAERKVAMGQQWHQQCFRCTTCGRFLDPGKHCENDGNPYCNTCYKNNFGPDGYRVGSIQPRPLLEPAQSPEEKADIISRIQDYNLYKDNKIDEIKHKELNGRVFFEGILKLYWGLTKPIVLASGNSNYGRGKGRESVYNYISIDDASFDKMIDEAVTTDDDNTKEELQRYMELTQYSLGTDELVSKGLNETAIEAFRTNGMDNEGHTDVNTINEENEVGEGYVIVHSDGETDDEFDDDPRPHSLTNSPSKGKVVYRQKSDVSEHRPQRTRHSAVRRRSASFRRVQKYKRQEAREEKRSKFIPPYGKSTNLRVSNLQRTEEVIGMLLQKYNVENQPYEFSMLVIHDNGAMEKLELSDSPLCVRLKLGPSEDVAKLYIMEAKDSENLGVSQEAAAYIRFQLPELNVFLKKFEEEEERELDKIKRRFEQWKDDIREMQKDRDPNNTSLAHPLEQQCEA